MKKLAIGSSEKFILANDGLNHYRFQVYTEWLFRPLELEHEDENTVFSFLHTIIVSYLPQFNGSDAQLIGFTWKMANTSSVEYLSACPQQSEDRFLGSDANVLLCYDYSKKKLDTQLIHDDIIGWCSWGRQCDEVKWNEISKYSREFSLLHPSCSH